MRFLEVRYKEAVEDVRTEPRLEDQLAISFSAATEDRPPAAVIVVTMHVRGCADIDRPRGPEQRRLRSSTNSCQKGVEEQDHREHLQKRVDVGNSAGRPP